MIVPLARKSVIAGSPNHATPPRPTGRGGVTRFERSGTPRAPQPAVWGAGLDGPTSPRPSRPLPPAPRGGGPAVRHERSRHAATPVPGRGTVASSPLWMGPPDLPPGPDIARIGRWRHAQPTRCVAGQSPATAGVRPRSSSAPPSTAGPQPGRSTRPTGPPRHGFPGGGGRGGRPIERQVEERDTTEAEVIRSRRVPPGAARRGRPPREASARELRDRPVEIAGGPGRSGSGRGGRRQAGHWRRSSRRIRSCVARSVGCTDRHPRRRRRRTSRTRSRRSRWPHRPGTPCERPRTVARR